MLIDSHVHLNRREFQGRSSAVIDRAVAAGVRGFLEVGYDLPSSRAAVALARREPRLLAAVGIHPHDALQVADARGELTPGGQAVLEELERLASGPEVVALGEIGLDFYRDLSPRPAQRTALSLQLRLARRLGLPVVFHVRDAWPELMAQVDREGLPPRGGVLHSFSGDAPARDWALRRGLLLGVGGPVTYRGSGLPALLAGCRAEDLLLETDAPWLPPVPYRGQRNEPAYLVHTAERVAAVWNLPAAELARLTGANFAALFGRLPG